MTFSKEQLEALKAPLNKSHVKQRAQAGRQLSYIEGWHAIDEANRIFGFDNWDRELLSLRELGEPRLTGDKYRVAYMATVRIRVWSPGATFEDSRYINRDGTGYGSGIDKDLGQAHESAIKEAETDAMKRALMTFGNPFGLALYDKEQKNVVNETSPVEVKRDDFGLPPVDEPTHDQKLIYAALAMGIGKAISQKELETFKEDEIKPKLEELTPKQQDDITAAYKDRYRAMARRAA